MQLTNKKKPLSRRKWLNPYILKLDTFNQQLIGSEEMQLSLEERGLLLERVMSSESSYLELGSGSGGHLISLAERDRTSLFIGIELRFKRLVRTLEKARERRLSNLIGVRTDAATFYELFRPNSLNGIYVNFPDPWAKRRWKKHRLINTTLIEGVSRTLNSKGFFAFKTDCQEYFDEVLEVISNARGLEIEGQTTDLHSSCWADTNILTEFEGLFLSKGQKICFLRAVHK